jgi:hypothetical protein
MKPPTHDLAGLLEEAGRLASRAAGRVLDDPRSREALARAVGLAQRGLARLELLQQEALQAAGVPGRQGYQDLARRLARVKRKARELAARLEARRRGRGPGAAASPPVDPAREP